LPRSAETPRTNEQPLTRRTRTQRGVLSFLPWCFNGVEPHFAIGAFPRRARHRRLHSLSIDCRSVLRERPPSFEIALCHSCNRFTAKAWQPSRYWVIGITDGVVVQQTADASVVMNMTVAGRHD